jgi:phosphatidylserine/phosphatidylglycerophosphate/cardiolipin synthase-like enzyme
VYVEVQGPAASDVHHNFVQRWNEASERGADDGVWGHDGDDLLTFPRRLSPPRGKSVVQIQRMVSAGRYRDGHPTPEGRPYDIAGGERSILEQYLLAIDAARRSIYIENQAVPVPTIAVRLEDALKRGIEVVVLVPGDPEDHVRGARRNPEHKALFEQLAALGQYDNFSLVGTTGRNTHGGRSTVYVHSKIMLIDDAWATIGSCNLHSNSLFGHTEMNAAFWDPHVVRRLRCELLAEHLEQDTSHLDDRASLVLYRDTATANRLKRHANDSDWQGLAFSLEPATYGA